MIEQILNIINGLNKKQRSIFVAGFAILIAFLFFLVIYSGIQKNNQALRYIVASGLTKAQVASASAQLESEGIEFLIIGTGDNLILKTSQQNVNIAKIKLLTSNAIETKHTGWEIFDKSSLGSTAFENNIKYLRAIEGELSRSLESLALIVKANVKIALPKDSIFVKTKTPPSASAVLHIKSGGSLSKKQIAGIKAFMATAIANLAPERISLISQDGTLIDEQDAYIDGKSFAVHANYQKQIENDYEQKILALLVPFLGSNRVIAKVSISLDFKNTRATKEIFAPDGTIRSSQARETKIVDEVLSASNSITPGVQSNIDKAKVIRATGPKSQSSKNDVENTINYEISKTIINEIDYGYSKITHITASITFDSAVLDTIEDRDVFIQNMESVVKEAIGYKKSRNDQVSVQPFRFIHLDDTQEINLDSNKFAVLSFLKLIADEFGVYVQYIIIASLLLFFYKKFIGDKSLKDMAKSEFGVDIATEGAGGSALSSLEKASELLNDNENFDLKKADDKLKQRIRKQILDNINDVDEEDLIKYQILLEELTKKVDDNPGSVAQIIDMLIDDSQLVKGRRKA